MKILTIGKNFAEFKIINSTNSFIKRNIKNLPNGFVAFSTNQVKGYGTKGRIWANFKNENLAVSVLFKHIDINFLNVSTKLACVCALSALNNLEIQNVKIKWFNDLTIENKKVAGVLGEAQFFGSEIHCVLGLGLNLLQQPSSFKRTNLVSAGSVLSTTQKAIEPKLFLKHYIDYLNFFTHQLQHSNFNIYKTIQKIYLKNCTTIGQRLKIVNSLNQTSFLATASQILTNGNLLVKTNSQQLLELSPDRFSVHKIHKP